ncbi:MAG: response regulator [Pseudomonadota bacterium]
MSISVIIVDNEQVDRFIARRRFSRSKRFGEIFEFSSGIDFVRAFRLPPGIDMPAGHTTLVLMDIRMPGLDGFQTIRNLMSQLPEGSEANGLVFAICSSSNSALDRERAAGISEIKAYIAKPLLQDDVDRLAELCVA